MQAQRNAGNQLHSDPVRHVSHDRTRHRQRPRPRHVGPDPHLSESEDKAEVKTSATLGPWGKAGRACRIRAKAGRKAGWAGGWLCGWLDKWYYSSSSSSSSGVVVVVVVVLQLQTTCTVLTHKCTSKATTIHSLALILLLRIQLAWMTMLSYQCVNFVAPPEMTRKSNSRRPTRWKSSTRTSGTQTCAVELGAIQGHINTRIPP